MKDAYACVAKIVSPVVLLPLFAMALFAQEPSAAVDAPVPAAIDENVVYGTVNGSDLHLDVYKPSGSFVGVRPAVVLIHGGGWTSLDKSTMRGMGRFLAATGFVGFSIDYRLLKSADTRWPAQLDDAQRAVRWVRANAAKYNVDPNRIGAFGHSAGAQIAALLGMKDTRDNSDPALAKYSSRVEAVVDVSGPSDFTTLQGGPDGLRFLAALFGTDTTHPEAWRDASPALCAKKGDAPFLVVHGTKDDTVPISQAEELVQKLRDAKIPVTFIQVTDGHTFETPKAKKKLADETLKFFQRYLVRD